MSAPICSLPAEARPARRAQFAHVLTTLPHRVATTPWSVRWDFDDAEGWLSVAELLDAERRCCPSLRFALVLVPARSGPKMRLTVRGPRGTPDFMASWLPLGSLPDPKTGKSGGAVTTSRDTALAFPERRAWPWWGGGLALTGGAAAVLCCVLPMGAGLAGAVGLSVAWFDVVGGVLSSVGLGLLAWGWVRMRRGQRTIGPSCGCASGASSVGPGARPSKR